MRYFKSINPDRDEDIYVISGEKMYSARNRNFPNNIELMEPIEMASCQYLDFLPEANLMTYRYNGSLEKFLCYEVFPAPKDPILEGAF